jgi:hypothetical protein
MRMMFNALGVASTVVTMTALVPPASPQRVARVSARVWGPVYPFDLQKTAKMLASALVA